MIRISGLLLILIGFLPGQDFSGYIFEDIRGNFPEDQMVLYLEALPKQPASFLEPANFQLSAGDQPVDSFSVEPYLETGEPVSVLFCVDVSGTMAGQPFANVREAIKTLLRKFHPAVKTGLCVFGDQYRLLQDFTSDRQKLYMVLNALTAASQNTELYYGLNKALELFEKPSTPPMRFLIVFSDGKNEGSTAYTLDDVVQKAGQNRVLVHTVGYSRIDPVYMKNLEKLADKSGGIFIRPDSPQDIDDAYQQIYRYMRSFYRLRFNLDGIKKGTVAPLKVSVISGERTGTIFSERYVAVPAGSSTAYLMGLLAAVVLLLVAAVWIYRKKKKAVNRLENFHHREKIGLEDQIDKYRQNLGYLESEIQKKEKEARIPDEPEATRVVDPNLPESCYLKFDDSEPEQRLFELTEFPVKIGKLKSCQVILTHPTVSRVHAILKKIDDTYVLEDQNSTNGTWINGKRINRNRLLGGETIRFGKSSCRFEIV